MQTEELIKRVEDESLPIEERVKAAKELWKIELLERPLTEYRPISAFPYSTEKKDVYEAVEFQKYPEGSLEDILYKGLAEFYRQIAERTVSKVDASKLLDYSVSADPFLKEAARKRLFELKAEEVEKVGIIDEAIAKREMAEAMRKQAELMLKNLPRTSSPFSFKFLSEAQTKSIKRPTRWYARQAFKNGIWEERWGDPEQYGIDPSKSIWYVSKPQSIGFIKMLLWKGVWRDDWGVPEEWYEKL